MAPQTSHFILSFPQPPSGRTPKLACGTHTSLDFPLDCGVLSHDPSRVVAHAEFDNTRDICVSAVVHAGEAIGKGHPIYSAGPYSDPSSPPSPTFSPTSPKSTLAAFDYPSTPVAPPVDGQTTMVKKRRSLQAILIPPFFHPSHSPEEEASPPSASQRTRSQSAAATTTAQFALPPAIPILPSASSSSSRSAAIRNSPPSDLLDDDPFANLSPGPSTLVFDEAAVSSRRPSLVQGAVALEENAVPPRATPRSPLAHSAADLDMNPGSIAPWLHSPPPPPPTPIPSRRAVSSVLPRPRSSGHGQVRPAYTRPAFSARPSLPSLHTLAQMNVVVPKVKRGRVGAKLPTEPWSMVDSLPPDLAGPSYPMLPATSTPNSVIGSGIFVQEPDSYGTPDDSQEQDGSGERASSSESDTSTPYSSDVGDGQSCASVISQSSFDAYPSSLIPFDNFDTHASQCAEDSCSSPEPSFPPTPRLGVNVPAFLSTGYPSLFSPQSRPSFYDDLSATLEYDYSQAASRLPSSPPAQDAVSSLTLDESSPCDFQPGSSVQTIRAYNLQDQPPSHFRSSPCQDGTAPGHSHMDSLPLSPTTIRADDNAPRPTSSVSSACDDDADFVSIASDTSDEEYLTAPLSRSPSPTARLPRLEGSATLGLRLPSAEDPELSESSGVDIRERLSRLSFLTQSDAGSSRYASAHEYVDAAEEGSRSTRTQSQRGESSRQGGSNGRHQGSSSGYGSGQAGGVGFGGGSGGGRRDRDGDDDRYRRPHPRAAAPDYTTSETSSDDSSDEEETPRRTRPARRRGRSSSSSADDDVPLAQQIPTALRAQRTIRRQVRDEAVQKRRARSLRRPDPVEPPTSELPPLPTQRVTPERSASRPPSASRAPPIPQSPPKLAGRPRTKTLPSQIGGIPFSVGELTKKLLTTQTAPPLPQPPAAASTRTSQDVPGPLSPQHISSHLPSQHEQHANLRAPAQESISAVRLRAMRSFHRPRTTGGESELPPAVPAAGAQLGRSKTSATRRAQPLESQPAPALPPLAATGLERARSTRSHSRRPSVDRSARPSLDQEARPPMPPLPVAVTKMPAWQQRVFVNNLQRFHQVEITAASTARDVLEALQGQNALDNGAASGWMMWEVSQDFGMERPIRSFEVLSDVTNSWVTDKTVNFLMAKKTLLAPKLSRAAIPSSSPVCGGFVQWEYKRGKWQKRWLELREHSLWLSKRDTGKDQVQLCSLNNFDAYVVTRVSKAPKSYIFAVKSTDNISFFESTSDYVHIFSCDQKEGENWVEKILIARSYILYQDRNVLSTTGATANPGAGLSRAGTRKRPAQPLVNFSAAQTVSAAEPPPALTPVFAPGSLLAKNS